MTIKIRRADEHDFPAILSLIKEFSVFQKTPEKVTITMQQMLDGTDNFQCIVAETKSKQITGFATFFFTWYSWSGKGLYLDDLFVKDDFRNQSIGKKLLNAVIDIAKDAQCIRVRWQVSGWNINAIDFYKKMGAIVDGTDINCDLLIN